MRFLIIFLSFIFTFHFSLFTLVEASSLLPHLDAARPNLSENIQRQAGPEEGVVKESLPAETDRQSVDEEVEEGGLAEASQGNSETKEKKTAWFWWVVIFTLLLSATLSVYLPLRRIKARRQISDHKI